MRLSVPWIGAHWADGASLAGGGGGQLAQGRLATCCWFVDLELGDAPGSSTKKHIRSTSQLRSSPRPAITIADIASLSGKLIAELAGRSSEGLGQPRLCWSNAPARWLHFGAPWMT